MTELTIIVALVFFPAEGVPHIRLVAPRTQRSMTSVQFILNIANTFMMGRRNCLGHVVELVPCLIERSLKVTAFGASSSCEHSTCFLAHCDFGAGMRVLHLNTPRVFLASVESLGYHGLQEGK